ncbi:hypothetical protein GAYE_SCF23G4300 [Galdieria yellowstonensis]|uniref:CHCH domain-containing protein n=1 Tax=Galdieria yellowstonensis TaxID=3028027 RepID=A0AAV9IGN0_9RHOD|nr:hypothetical protein GAYE_SCF23G4300 [Galdieria yellowstonensis]
MGRRGGSGAARRTPLRSKPPLFAKREREEATTKQSSRPASSLANVKNNPTSGNQREKTNQTTTPPTQKPSMTSSLFGGMLGSMLPMFLFMNWFRRNPEEREPDKDEIAQKKCQRLACNIQDCLEKNDYQQSMCEEAIRKYKACMEAAKGNYENLG